MKTKNNKQTNYKLDESILILMTCRSVSGRVTSTTQSRDERVNQMNRSLMFERSMTCAFLFGQP